MNITTNKKQKHPVPIQANKYRVFKGFEQGPAGYSQNSMFIHLLITYNNVYYLYIYIYITLSPLFQGSLILIFYN